MARKSKKSRISGSLLASDKNKIVEEWKVRSPQIFQDAASLLFSTYGLKCGCAERPFVYLETEVSHYLTELFSSQWFWSNMNGPFGALDDYDGYIIKSVESNLSKIGHGRPWLEVSKYYRANGRLEVAAKSVKLQIESEGQHFGKWVVDLAQAVGYDGTMPACKKEGLEIMVADRFFYKFKPLWFFDEVANSYRDQIEQRSPALKRKRKVKVGVNQ